MDEFRSLVVLQLILLAVGGGLYTDMTDTGTTDVLGGFNPPLQILLVLGCVRT